MNLKKSLVAAAMFAIAAAFADGAAHGACAYRDMINKIYPIIISVLQK